MSRKYYYVANWKMYWNFTQTIEFAAQNYDNLLALCSSKDATIILCPSIPALYPLVQKFTGTPIHIGAQDCSDYQAGAYTGQVSAQHLKTAGAQYCIIGHSERRKYNGETNNTVAEKFLNLLTAAVTPIICIGETLEENQGNKTLSVLQSQLEIIAEIVQKNLPTLHKKETIQNPILIAYEPVWAIGTGLVPNPQQLDVVFSWLSHFVENNFSGIACHLLYGGSIASKNIMSLKEVDLIDGFLIGGASLDAEEFTKIVKSGT